MGLNCWSPLQVKSNSWAQCKVSTKLPSRIFASFNLLKDPGTIWRKKVHLQQLFLRRKVCFETFNFTFLSPVLQKPPTWKQIFLISVSPILSCKRFGLLPEKENTNSFKKRTKIYKRFWTVLEFDIFKLVDVVHNN